MPWVSLQEEQWVKGSYRTTVAVLILAVHHMIGSGVFPPDQLVEQIVEPWDEPELGQHLVDLQGTQYRRQKNTQLRLKTTLQFKSWGKKEKKERFC